ncbi:TolC family protein [Sandaracinus amylolyticus]|uniref:Heavy metal RND efflux outer membrane protein, CzcC family n=1 Tax=Sandaracinus amylolyticus TaxID=927083 RepID=A0A0F6W1G3_9BACT|nr:TolC family protein [Sandaracinus amylolyticus]AKF05011.1 Heavy metal RND efflux outer membrane protein, CzcC family [Sandaracinus amylolyticus]
MTHLRAPWLALVLALAPTIVRAQDAMPDEISLADLLDRAQRSPRVRVEAALAEAYRGDVREAGQHPNPVLSYEVAGFLGGIETNGGSQQELRVSQPLLWPGQVDRRIDAARARLDLARARTDALRAALSIELRRAYVALLGAQERAAVLVEAETSMERLASIVRGRAEAGAGRRWDVTRIEGELASVRAARDVAAAELLAASARIGALLGAPGWLPRARGVLADLPPVRPRDELLEDHPMLVVARGAHRAAVMRAEAERALAIPPIELTLGTIVSTAPEGGYLIGGVAMPLPFFDANQGAIERAEREADAAELARDATRLELEAALAGARRVVSLRRDALAAYEREVVERLPLLAEMAEAAYQGGEVGVFEVLDAVRATRELRTERVDREESLRLSEIDLLEAALGAALAD